MSNVTSPEVKLPFAASPEQLEGHRKYLVDELRFAREWYAFQAEKFPMAIIALWMICDPKSTDAELFSALRTDPELIGLIKNLARTQLAELGVEYADQHPPAAAPIDPKV